MDRSIPESTGSEESHIGWSHIAQSIASQSSDEKVDAPRVIQLAALQCAYHDILKALQSASPGYFSQVAEEGNRHEPATTLMKPWSVPTRIVNLYAIFIVDTLSLNPAVESLSKSLGLERWRKESNCRAWAALITRIAGDYESPGAFSGSFIDILRAPAKAFPEDLSKQVRWVVENWKPYLSEFALELFQLALDVEAEIEAMRFSGPGPAELPTFGVGAHELGSGFVDESARFSDDADWMPRLVMMAKQSYVWLDQLSKQYGRHIERLDQIPDEELDILAARGFGGLWLIGLWERSEASRDIKVRRGNPEAAPSAYALRGYSIAHKLGGDSALENLRSRANHRGLRLAADMVPNHMGMDSDWMAEHPERFLQLPHPPYPGYSFNGPNLSHDDRLEVYLEDGYWDERDAAVVFKSVHRDNGQVRYVYHGNDGTQMPWNDTAQLDYLQPAVREAVIQTILDVARRFPVIRFDAAMTLARKHISRLWYPPPGQGGAIPSRSENTVPTEVFDQMVPGEFWREVVERVRQEVPDTLLLAEAFWMMEGYFVRTLGMHRVYNSAFMHMLRDEDNAGYRGGIKSVLEYSPAILERYVNFMNNPDEETAVEQFGKGDKYFGIATMMATLPGLPMFGHGQVEGFSEKYGMEYTRAYRDEQPDSGLVEHHERVIFPILRERHLFCGVGDFSLFDFWKGESVDENVFAYSNRSRSTGESSLVVYHNRYGETAGWIRSSTAINIGEHDAPNLIHRSLGEALGLKNDPDQLYAFWELRRRSWLIRSGQELCEQGLYASLQAYEALVFTKIWELTKDNDHYQALASNSGGDWIHESLFHPELETKPIAESIEDAELEDTEEETDTSKNSASSSKASDAESQSPHDDNQESKKNLNDSSDGEE